MRNGGPASAETGIRARHQQMIDASLPMVPPSQVWDGNQVETGRQASTCCSPYVSWQGRDEAGEGSNLTPFRAPPGNNRARQQCSPHAGGGADVVFGRPVFPSGSAADLASRRTRAVRLVLHAENRGSGRQRLGLTTKVVALVDALGKLMLRSSSRTTFYDSVGVDRLVRRSSLPFAPHCRLEPSDRSGTGLEVLEPSGGAPYVFLRTGRRVSITPEFPNQPARPIRRSSNRRVGVMVTKQLSIAIAISICVGSGIAFKTLAAAPASATRIDFDQVFADVTRQGTGYVDRARKRDRLPSFKTVSPEPSLLPYCEPLASPFTDPILGSIVGRCDA